jgi:hypothetical protein
MTAFSTRAVHAGHDPAQHNGSLAVSLGSVESLI